MFTKFGLVVLVVVFGALLFVLGLLAPEPVRRSVTQWTYNITAAREATTVKSPPKALAAAANASATKKSGAAPIPYAQLLIPTPPPPHGTYSLQLGLYPTTAGADDWVKRARAADVPASTISVLDENGQSWIAVAAGEYNSPEEARAARISLTRTLTLVQPLMVIRLPSQPSSATPVAP